MLISKKMFSTSSAYYCSCSIAFFSPKAFWVIDTAEKSLAGRAPRLRELTTLPRPPSWMGKGTSPPQSPSTPSASWYQRLWHILSLTPPKFFSAYGRAGLWRSAAGDALRGGSTLEQGCCSTPDFGLAPPISVGQNFVTVMNYRHRHHHHHHH